MKKNNRYLDILRIVSFIAILLYHFNLLKGGFLAVCAFFTLSGYLTVKSLYKEDKINFWEYYKNKFLRLYLPILIVIFISVGIISFMDSINYYNLKPEVKSILLNINNFWQLKANSDYFTRSTDSPFTHMWYMSILIQFDLVIPFIVALFKKMKNKIVPCMLVSILSLSSTAFFFYSFYKFGIMTSYYHTLARVFSLLIGMLVFYIESAKKKKHKMNVFNVIILITYFLLLLSSFYFIKSDSILYPYAMVIITLITARIITYSNFMVSKENFFDKILKYLSKISYPVYLIQFPIIFIFGYIEIKYNLLIQIGLLLVLSVILAFATDYKHKLKIFRRIILFLLIALSLHGVYEFVIAKDYTDEMNALREQIAANEKMLEEREKERLANAKAEEEEYNNLIKQLEENESNLGEVIKKMPFAIVGDSVLYGATSRFAQTFTNAHIDAAVSRRDCEAEPIIKELVENNKTNGTLVLVLGTNRTCGDATIDSILNMTKGIDVFWLTVSNNNEYFNSRIHNFQPKYPHLHVIEWKELTRYHKEYFIADGIHVNSRGSEFFTNTIYNELYAFYKVKFQKQREEAIQEHQSSIKDKVTIYGNDIIVNNFDEIKNKFVDSNINIKNYTYTEIKEIIESSIKDDTITNTLVFAFDSTNKITTKEYTELVELIKDKKVYIISYNNLDKLNSDSITTLNMKAMVDSTPSLLMPDKVHLSDSGNKLLMEFLNKKNQE